MDNIIKDPIVCWDKKVPDTGLEKFQKIIERKYNVKFGKCIIFNDLLNFTKLPLVYCECFLNSF